MWVCPNGHEIDVVLALIPEDLDPDRLGVQVSAETGLARNLWGDGIAGVSNDAKNLAEEDEEPICPECHAACTWQGPKQKR